MRDTLVEVRVVEDGRVLSCLVAVVPAYSDPAPALTEQRLQVVHLRLERLLEPAIEQQTESSAVCNCGRADHEEGTDPMMSYSNWRIVSSTLHRLSAQGCQPTQAQSKFSLLSQT